MKKWIISGLIISNVFASSISENLSYKEEPTKKEENIGHFIFSVGVGSSFDDPYEVFPTLAIGYQSKITAGPIFHSAGIEWERKIPGTKSFTTPKEQEKDFGIFRLYGLHYFVKEGSARYFIAPGLAGSGNAVYTQKDKTGLIHFMENIDVSLALGVESGAPSGTINRFQIRCEYPVLNMSKNYFVEPTPRWLCSFGIGF
ncbi:hypothetical protein K0U07_01940 [bacterium]|nr:hypothetical protein [bacterium]